MRNVHPWMQDRAGDACGLRKRRGPAARLATLLASPVVALLAACSDARPERPNVILISLDTLRADHLGCYGYPRPTSPFLDSLARRATLFEEAYAPFPSTLVSHMSMFTGRHPREHGVFPPNAVLHPDVETFPEVTVTTSGQWQIERTKRSRVYA